MYNYFYTGQIVHNIRVYPRHGFVVYKDDNEVEFFYTVWTKIYTYFVYFKSEGKTQFDRFVDLNILGALCLVHSDLRISHLLFFLLDLNESMVQR